MTQPLADGYEDSRMLKCDVFKRLFTNPWDVSAGQNRWYWGLYFTVGWTFDTKRGGTKPGSVAYPERARIQENQSARIRGFRHSLQGNNLILEGFLQALSKLHPGTEVCWCWSSGVLTVPILHNKQPLVFSLYICGQFFHLKGTFISARSCRD